MHYKMCNRLATAGLNHSAACPAPQSSALRLAGCWTASCAPRVQCGRAITVFASQRPFRLGLLLLAVLLRLRGNDVAAAAAAAVARNVEAFRNETFGNVVAYFERRRPGGRRRVEDTETQCRKLDLIKGPCNVVPGRREERVASNGRHLGQRPGRRGSSCRDSQKMRLRRESGAEDNLGERRGRERRHGGRLRQVVDTLV